jgi:hypothetical protein
MYKIFHECEKPVILVITPLKPGDKISRETKVTTKRNDIPFVWVTYEGPNNPAKNTEIAYNIYKEWHKEMPPYVFKLDNDIVMSRGMLDKMFYTLDGERRNNTNVGYTYCGFKFTGVLHNEFPIQEFDIVKLLKSNYISYNSLIRTDSLEKCGGFITDNKYWRLLDWSLWLTMLSYGIIGKPTYRASFIAMSKAGNVSAGSNDEYAKKYRNVYDDIIQPLIKKIVDKELIF